MSQPVPQTHLSNVQLELLKLFPYNVSDEEIADIKRLLADYFAKRTIAIADKLWEERGLTQADMEKWLYEDHRKRLTTLKTP